MPVSRVRVRERGAIGETDRIRFTSAILPKWPRRTRSLDALLPILYLLGVSTSDFQEALLAFYDFPAEHWDHLRTTNPPPASPASYACRSLKLAPPIESVFATVHHRTVRTKGALSSTTARLMVVTLVMAAAKTWWRLKGENQLPKIVGVTFKDATEVTKLPSDRAA